MKLSRIFIIALVAFIWSIPSAVVAQTATDTTDARIAKEFMLYTSETTVVPTDIGIAGRLTMSQARHRDKGSQELKGNYAGGARLFGFIGGIVQVDAGYGLAGSTHHLQGGLKVDVVTFGAASIGGRYEFNSHSVDELTVDGMSSTHGLTLIATRWFGPLMLNFELGYLISENSAIQRDVFRFGIAYPVYDEVNLILDVQRYGRVDEHYMDVAMFGNRYMPLEWLSWDWALQFIDTGTDRDIGLWVAVQLHQ